MPKLIFGAFYQSGQSCISVQRCLIREVRALQACLHEQIVVRSPQGSLPQLAILCSCGRSVHEDNDKHSRSPQISDYLQ